MSETIMHEEDLVVLDFTCVGTDIVNISQK